MFIDQSDLASVIVIFSSILIGFVVALWLVLVIWTYRDIRSRTRDKLVPVLASIMVFLLFLPGWVLYLILRPQKTLEDIYRQSLEEETLLQTIEEVNACPGCERQVDFDWMICPSCQTILRKSCKQCGKLIELSWDICPYCTTPVPGMRKEVHQSPTDEKEISEIDVDI
jgi:RNA polymerase subunit RPABC4/transcription elongation factor Spt4